MGRSQSAESRLLGGLTRAREGLGRRPKGRQSQRRVVGRRCCSSREAQSRSAAAGGQAATGEDASSDCPCWPWCGSTWWTGMGGCGQMTDGQFGRGGNFLRRWETCKCRTRAGCCVTGLRLTEKLPRRAGSGRYLKARGVDAVSGSAGRQQRLGLLLQCDNLLGEDRRLQAGLCDPRASWAVAHGPRGAAAHVTGCRLTATVRWGDDDGGDEGQRAWAERRWARPISRVRGHAGSARASRRRARHSTAAAAVQ